MTSPNPFAQNVPAEQTAQPAAAPQGSPNPFAQNVPTSAPAAPVQQQNPYGQQPQQQYAPHPAAQGPYGQAPAAPAQQQYAPAAPQQTAPPALDMGRLASAGAPVVGEGRGAKLPDMFGRLVLIFPLSKTRVPRNPQYITPEQRASGNVDQDRVTATVVVLDDGRGGMAPIEFGGAPYALPPTPHTDRAELPYVRKAMWINQSRLISQLDSSLPAGPGQPCGMVAGRLTKAGPNQNDPWYLIGATEQEMGLVQAYLRLVSEGRYPHPLA